MPRLIHIGTRLAMRRRVALWAVVAFLVGAQVADGSAASAATLAEIEKRGYMLVATEDEYRPFEFVVDGKPTGFDNELLEMLRKWVKFEVRQEILPWQGLLAAVATGKYDVALSAASITEERARSLDFTRPIAEGTHYYVKRKGDESIKSVKDLSGKTVGVTTGSAMYLLLPELEEMLKRTGGRLGKVAQYPTYQEVYQDLHNRRLDYAINSIVALSSLVRERPNDFELGEAVSRRTYHAWAVKKGNKELLALLNAFLKEMRQTGKLTPLEEKWFARRFDALPDEPRLPGDRPIR